MSYACIYVPDFSVEAILRNSPELRRQPFAVLDGTPPLVHVIAANALARESGIEVGMTKLQAETCPGTHLRRRSIVQEAAARDALIDCACGFSPRVECTEPPAVAGGARRFSDTFILDVAGLNRLLGPPMQVARSLSSAITKMGLEANVAIASNPDAAMHLARGFPGITVAAPGTEARHMAKLPIHLLEPLPEMLETLERWGIRDFGSLAALPEVALSQRLGQEGLRLQRLAQGRTQRSLVPVEPPVKFEEAVELEDAIELLEPLMFVLNCLLSQICARLVARALATNELRLTLETTGYEDQSAEEQAARRAVHQRSIQFPVPMQDSRTFLKLLELDLAAHSPIGPVKKIVLAAEAAPPRFAQAGLFLPRGPAPERLELTLARIRGIVGDHCVGSAELLDTHAPDAFRMRPFHPQIASSGGSSGHNGRGVMHRPALRKFRPPLQTKVQIKRGMPARVFLRGQVLQVTAAAGPWRKSGGWWSEQSWTRDEWDLELHADQTPPMLVRVYRDLSSAKWFVEGRLD